MTTKKDADDDHDIGMRCSSRTSPSVKRFKFERSTETEVPLELKATITMAPKNGIHVKIVSRE